jgi:cold shock CspA family protein
MFGYVEKWDSARRFGLIQTRARGHSGGRVFVHVSGIAPRLSLEAGWLVSFTLVTDDPRGPRAVDVRRLPAKCPKCDRHLQVLRCRACGFTYGPSDEAAATAGYKNPPVFRG